MKPYYEQDGITIYCGDCRDVLPELPKADLVLTDPPYGVGENSRRVGSRAKAYGSKSFGVKNSRKRIIQTIDYGNFEWDKEPASQELICLSVSAGKRAIIWGGNFFEVSPSRGWLVWDKLNSGDFADCELAWTNLEMSVRIFRHRWNGMIRASENKSPRVHPTQKPIALMKWCLLLASERYGINTIVDPFCGSGSVLIAAKQLNRKAIGIDKEERYCEIAADRLRQGVLTW